MNALHTKLNEYLAWQALSQFERKGLFKEPYWRFGEYLGFATAMYETSRAFLI